MAWESVGQISTGQMPNDRAWILFGYETAKRYIELVCGAAPLGSKLDIMWHEHELGDYPSLGVWSDYEPPWDYINACERAFEVFDEAVSWYDLKEHFERQQEDSEED